MAMFCIPKKKIAEFRKALKDKKLDIRKLLQMSTEERTKLFAKFAGEDAKDVNLLFEQKLLLKNWVQGVKNWASKVGEVGRYDPLEKAKMEELMKDFREQQRKRLLSPDEKESFLSDAVEAKLGTSISKGEAKTLFDLQTKANKLKEKIDIDTPRQLRSPEQQRIASEYGAAQVAANKYVDILKGQGSLRDTVKAAKQEFKEDWEEDKITAIGKVVMKSIKSITDNSISMVASFDNSFMGRQGMHLLNTHPKIWWKMAKKSFSDIYKTLGGKDSRDALMADVYSRPN